MPLNHVVSVDPVLRVENAAESMSLVSLHSWPHPHPPSASVSVEEALEGDQHPEVIRHDDSTGDEIEPIDNPSTDDPFTSAGVYGQGTDPLDLMESLSDAPSGVDDETHLSGTTENNEETVSNGSEYDYSDSFDIDSEEEDDSTSADGVSIMTFDAEGERVQGRRSYSIVGYHEWTRRLPHDVCCNCRIVRVVPVFFIPRAVLYSTPSVFLHIEQQLQDEHGRGEWMECIHTKEIVWVPYTYEVKSIIATDFD
jgi:hypothetical protein